MTFENDDLELESGDLAGPPPVASANRSFLIAAGILGGITLLALVLIAAYAFLFFIPGQRQRATEAALAFLQSTEVAQAVTQTADARFFTNTPRPTQTSTNTPIPTNTLLPTSTLQPTRTSVLAVATNTSVAAQPGRTATVAALLTEAAAPTATTTPTAILPTRLPQSGFAEDAGAPGLLGLAIGLVAVIFLARRLRTSLPG